MIFIRTIMAAMIAFSVAALPATGAAIALPSEGQTAMAGQPDMPCCPSCNTQDDAKLAACALKCATVVGVVFSAPVMAPSYWADASLPIFAEDRLHEFLRAPPTHPPPL
jgi:hypothetical protein